MNTVCVYSSHSHWSCNCSRQLHGMFTCPVNDCIVALVFLFIFHPLSYGAFVFLLCVAPLVLEERRLNPLWTLCTVKLTINIHLTWLDLIWLSFFPCNKGGEPESNRTDQSVKPANNLLSWSGVFYVQIVLTADRQHFLNCIIGYFV